jgi:long-chain fatty acid transport protein
MLRKLLVTCVFLIPSLVFSQGFQVNFQGQKQQGMGCAGTALYQDGASLFFNPGSVGFSNENSVNVAMTNVLANVLYVDSATGQGYRTNNPIGTPFSAYGLFQAKKEARLKFGIAAYTPFGSTVQYEDGWIGRFALTRLELKAIFIQPTIAYRINDHVSIGGGPILVTGNVNLQKDIPVQFTDGTYGHAELSGKATGFGYNIGLHNKLDDHWSLGLTYRSRVNMSLANGQATFTVPEALAANFPSGAFSSSLPLPSVTTLGLAYASGEKFSAVLDVNYVGWEAYDTLAFDYEVNTASLIDTKSARKYENIFAFRGGIAYKVIEEMDVRFGGGFGFSPVQNGYVTPETPDRNRWYGTFGWTYRFGEHFSMDLSVYYTQLKRGDRNVETDLAGTFTTKAIAPGFSLVYKW